MALRISMPEQLAPEARELLLAFWEWCARPEHEHMLEDERWTVEQIIDMFILEATTTLSE
jgi:hypothetical protein